MFARHLCKKTCAIRHQNVGHPKVELLIAAMRVVMLALRLPTFGAQAWCLEDEGGTKNNRSK